ncbi:hypothetical protein CCACVL1_28714, partial [Corchorus capsularis]
NLRVSIRSGVPSMKSNCVLARSGTNSMFKP